MPKSRPRIPFNVRLDPDVYDALDEHCRTLGETKTEVVDKALRRILRMKSKEAP